MLEIKKFKDIPWKNIKYDCVWYIVVEPENSKHKGHQIYIPKEDNLANIREALTAAYRFSSNTYLVNKTIGYKLVMEFGENSDAEISWPHIHVIPIISKIKRKLKKV